MSRQLTPDERDFILSTLRKTAGIIVIDAPEGMQTIVRYLSEIVPPELVAMAEHEADLFFTYDMAKCGVEEDGYSIWSTNSTGRTITALGMATQAIRQGRDYAAMIWAHELTHLVTRVPGHTAAFHQYLDYLLAEIEDYSGITVKNDYFDLPEKDKPLKGHKIAP